jgi:hypothetical protein
MFYGPAAADDCHPQLDPAKPQYTVGYGSLMESSSKLATEPNAGINLPVLLSGFQRSWNTKGVYPTTYLGVERSGSATMVAALYRDFLNDDGKLASDSRNIDSCRAAVDPARLIFGRSLFGSIPIFAAYLSRQARYDGFDHGKFLT